MVQRAAGRRESKAALPADARRAKAGSREPDNAGSREPGAGSRFLIALALASAIAAVYGQVWGFDFVSWDDPWYVSKNPHVVGGLSWPAAWWAFTTGGDFYWHPLTWLSHQLDASLFGLNAGGHHLTSVLLHIANALLLFALLDASRAFARVTRPTDGLPAQASVPGPFALAAVAAALFALHPLRVESVAWVAERKDVLSGLCWMLTMAAYLRYASQPGWRRYLLVVTAFGLGLMAKPMIVTLPLVLLLLDVWPLGRWAGGSPQPAAGSLSRVIRCPLSAERCQLIIEKLPLLAMSAVAAVATLVVQARAGAVGGLGELPLSYRVSNAVVSYVAYIGKMIWPVNLAAFYPYPSGLPAWWTVGLCALAIVSALVAAATLARTRPYVTTGALWYLVTLLPVSGLFQAGDQLMADRFTYLPSIGVVIIVVWGGADLAARAGRRLVPPRRWIPTAVAAATAAAAVIACAVAAHAQVSYWRNSETLWARALAVTDGNHRAHAGLAEWLSEHGRVDEATSHYREAVRLAPSGADYRHALGMILARQGQVAEAARELAEAVRLNPRHASARVSLGAVLARQGQVGEAILQYREALRVQPDLAVAHTNLGLARLQQGGMDEALGECGEAARLDAASADARLCQGVAFARLGKPEDAAAAFREAVRLDPSSEAAYVNLGLALSKSNRTVEAIEAFEKALRINPANEPVRLALQELRRKP